MKRLTMEQAEDAIKNGEFSEGIIGKGNVAIILTQDWCPQWHAMRSYIDEVDVTVYVFIYDDSFPEFIEFKEHILGNDLIPYMRYYKDGKLVGQSNYVSKEQFEEFFK